MGCERRRALLAQRGERAVHSDPAEPSTRGAAIPVLSEEQGQLSSAGHRALLSAYMPHNARETSQSLIMELPCNSLDHHTLSCSPCFQIIPNYV